MNIWIDISITINKGLPVWPGDTEPDIYKISSIEKGEETNVTSLTICAHTGTHIDAPLHYFTNGDDITKIDLNQLIGDARVLLIHSFSEITREELVQHNINKGDRILLKTKNSENNWPLEPFRKNYIALNPEAAKYLCEKEIALVGIDYLSISGYDHSTAVHTQLLSAGICIVEGLLLNSIEPGNYEMICLPIKIEHADGAPARVVIKKK